MRVEPGEEVVLDLVAVGLVEDLVTGAGPDPDGHVLEAGVEHRRRDLDGRVGAADRVDLDAYAGVDVVDLLNTLLDRLSAPR